MSGCAEVSFAPSGDMLLVSQITANTLTAFPVNADGTLGEPVENEPVGNGPFGFTFDGEGRLLVTQNSQAGVELGTVPSTRSVRTATSGRLAKLLPSARPIPAGSSSLLMASTAYITNFGPGGLLDVNAETVAAARFPASASVRMVRSNSSTPRRPNSGLARRTWPSVETGASSTR